MSVSIGLYEYNYDDLRAELVRQGAVDDDLLDNILLHCGHQYGEFYLVMDNEYYREFNPFTNLCRLLDAAFPTLKDRSGERSSYWDGAGDVLLDMVHQFHHGGVDLDVVAEALGVEI